uniref:Bms1-type G domain-containing protein n=1 Tax=Anopheles dirus TaxID=7168 RepID=A0A182N849_9DIPT
MADDSTNNEAKKAHKKRHSGVKADKKKAKNKPTDRTKNPKAFAITKARSAEKRFRRKEDLTTKKQHIPLVDKTPEEPPPILIAVVGPPKVGKTSLIVNLIKNFTKTNVTKVNGPITVVTSKKRRITLVECNNDINSMIDVAKCADLVLLMVDASFGFEMEIFEFLNICQVHGMPKIMGILNHLDMIKNAKALKMQKKVLKHRFWTEVYNGAKLFYLSGLIHGEYLKNEMHNLGRFISVMKFRPLTWRGAHSYIIADRMEDITNAEEIRLNAKCDRNVVLYGYVRGVPLKKENMVHIAGLGDMPIDELNTLPDPCPLPSGEKKRSLLEKERLLYAPMSGVGGIVYDKDAVYIELQGSHSHRKGVKDTEQQQIVDSFIEKKQTFDVTIENQEFRLFSGGAVIKSSDFVDEARKVDDDDDDDEDEEEEEDQEDEDEDEDSGLEDSGDEAEVGKGARLGWIPEEDGEEDDEEGSDDEEEEEDDDDDDMNDVETMGKKSRSSGYLSSDDDETILQGNTMAWKEGLAARARKDYLERLATNKNLMKIVYGVFSKFHKRQQERAAAEEGENEEDEEEDGLLGGIFKSVTQRQEELQKKKSVQDVDECCFFEEYGDSVRDWTTDDNKDLIRNCFVTGKWKASEDAEELLKLDDMSDGDSDVYGDFEDLETGEKHEAPKGSKQTSSGDADDKALDEGGKSTDDAKEGLKRKITRIEEKNMSRMELMAKKMKLKAKFDSEYDNPEKDDQHIEGDHHYYEKLKADALRQSELNKKEFANLDEDVRLNIEGHRAGLYVRMSFRNISAEFVEHFDPAYPVLIGGLNMVEENVGYVNCKVKKHRWYKKTLKTGDPLIISLGWRRFQTIPIYAKVEDDFKHRYLKYTPNHVTCSMSFWGPITPQNTGMMAIQSVAYDQQEMRKLGFRVAATGAVSESDKNVEIMKKLKLIGTPEKIFQKTAYIKGMFNSQLEVAKFEGAKVRTVSGIRGQIKKAVPPNGNFRATFEDRIQLSDIVFCRTWFRVTVPRFYAPVTNLLLPPEKKTEWVGMKTLGQLKRERNIQYEAKEDSTYKPIVREKLAFRPLVIPKALQKALPYKDKPKLAPLNPKRSFESERVAVVMSPHEQKVAKMMNMIKSNFKTKTIKQSRLVRERSKKYKKQMVNEKIKQLQRQKELKKKVFKAISKMDAKNEEKQKGGKKKYSMQSMESLYSNNSKFSALHRRKAARQPAIVITTNSDVRHRVMSARMLRLKQLQNQLEVANLHIAELTKDNRLLKALQKRQDSALSKYENSNAELPKLLHSHAEEIRTWQTKYRNLQNQNKELNSKLKAKDAHILTITDQNRHLVQLNKDKHLEERERLADRVRYLENRLMENDRDAKLLARRLQLETKNFKAQLQQEVLKQREMAQKLERAHQEINRLSSVIEIYEKRTPSTLLKNSSFLLKNSKPSSAQQQQLVRYTNGSSPKTPFPNFSEPSPVTNLDMSPKVSTAHDGEGDNKSPVPSPRTLQPISPHHDDTSPPVPQNSSKPRKKHSSKKQKVDEANGDEKQEEHQYDEGICSEFNQYALEQEAEFDKAIASELFRLQTEMGSGTTTKLLKNRTVKQYSATTETSYEDDYETDQSPEKTTVDRLTEIFEHKAHISEIEDQFRDVSSSATTNGYSTPKESVKVRGLKKRTNANFSETNDTDSVESGSRSSAAKELEAMKQEMHHSILKKEALLDTFCDELHGKEPLVKAPPQLNRPKLDNTKRTQIDPKKKQNLLEVLKAIDGDSFEK